MEKIIYKQESYNIIGKCFEVHNNLGAGFLEIVYKDALEYEFRKANIPYKREVKYEVNYFYFTKLSFYQFRTLLRQALHKYFCFF